MDTNFRTRAKDALRRTGTLSTAAGLRDKSQHVVDIARSVIFPSGRYVTCNGAPIHVTYEAALHRWYGKTNLFLAQEHSVFVELLREKPPGVVLDVGAHWGILPASLAVEDDPIIDQLTMVLCIEPDPMNLLNLTKTTAVIDRFRVNVVAVALGRDKGPARGFRGTGPCLQSYGADEFTTEMVDITEISLETLLTQQSISPQEVTHLKIDVDGYEPEILYEAETLLRSTKPYMLLEFWSKGLHELGIDVREYFRFLLSLGTVSKIEFPSGIETKLSEQDFESLESETFDSVRNLIVRMA